MQTVSFKHHSLIPNLTYKYDMMKLVELQKCPFCRQIPTKYTCHVLCSNEKDPIPPNSLIKPYHYYLNMVGKLNYEYFKKREKPSILSKLGSSLSRITQKNRIYPMLFLLLAASRIVYFLDIGKDLQEMINFSATFFIRAMIGTTLLGFIGYGVWNLKDSVEYLLNRILSNFEKKKEKQN